MKQQLRILGLLSLVSALAACAPSHQDIVAVDSGIESTGIIGGTDASGEEDFSKTIVSVYNVAVGGLCTGSIYSDTIIITAAHCVDGPSSSLRVVFGTEIRNADVRTIRRVDAYVVSPLWPFRQEEELNSGDIAVVKFSGGLPEGFKPAKILRDASSIKDGELVLLAGYGIDDGVNKAGSGRLRYVETTIENAKYSESEVLMQQRYGKGACHGDSGGPAYVKVRGEWVLFGVTNRGVNDPNDHCNGSAAYASIPFYMKWIERTALALNLRPKQSASDVRMAAGF
jgi:secreted trypsin-like serine protease